MARQTTDTLAAISGAGLGPISYWLLRIGGVNRVLPVGSYAIAALAAFPVLSGVALFDPALDEGLRRIVIVSLFFALAGIPLVFGGSLVGLRLLIECKENFAAIAEDRRDIEAAFAAKLVSGTAGPAPTAPAPMQQQAAPMQQQMAGFAGPPAGGSMAGIGAGGMPGGMSVQSVQFPNLQSGAGGGEQGNISLLMDVYMEMTVELGRTKKLIRDILGMGEGTIIELDKLAGEPVDILVNHKLIAKGEVVVIDENFGVRVTEIVSPMERVSDMT